ncbi:MAG: sigma-70 family RNA polymerase sigma factor [Anaerolineaceae bacterium]|nr:sigma-70 family RNA polymerase sigma factor [Anaerolineaceae bacterium]
MLSGPTLAEEEAHEQEERSRADENDLLRALQAGDDEAFVLLMQRMESPLRRYVRRLIGDGDAVDDIVQDVFFSLYRKNDRIDARRGLRPYLFRMARNRCYDELRRQGRFQSVSLDEEPEGESFSLAETLPDPAEPTDELAHWLFIQLVVRESMEKFPETQRQALILYAEEQMSYAEIAVATNTNPGTVRSRLSHARRTLRRLVPPWVLAELDGDTASGLSASPS